MLQNIEIMSTPAEADAQAQAGGCCGGGMCGVPSQAATATTAQSFEVEA